MSKQFFLFIFFLGAAGAQLPLPGQESSPSTVQVSEEPPLPQENEPALPPELIEELEKADQFGDSRFSESFKKMLVILAGIVLFMLLTKWALKRVLSLPAAASPLSGGIKILDRRALSPRTTLFVLEILGKKLAVAESMNGISVLLEHDALKEPETEKSPLE